MSLKEFIRELNGKKIEGEIIKTILISLLTSLILLAILYFLKLKDIPGVIEKYGIYLFFSALSYAIILPAVRQVRAYKKFPCMSGMMIGMTIGMIAGFLPGFYTGATNGMFYGGIFGVSVGILFGIWNGKCCGIMGVMEGIMAGFMGGIMGAMTAVMMLNDNLKAASLIVFLISATIILGLNYMIFKETEGIERKLEEGNLFTVFWSFVLTAATTWLMLLGPRSILFG